MSQAYIGADGAVHPVGRFPIAKSQELSGAILRVQSLVDRDAIQFTYRAEGMLVWVIDSAAHYTLAGGITNDSWVKLNLTGTVGGVGVEVDPLSTHITDTAAMLAPYLRWVDTTGRWQTKLDTALINFWNHGGDISNFYQTTEQTYNTIDSILNARKTVYNTGQFTVIPLGGNKDSVVLNPLNLADTSWRNSPLFGTSQERINLWDAGVDLSNYLTDDQISQRIHDSLTKYIVYLDSDYYSGNGNDPSSPLRNKLKTINNDSIHGVGNLTITGSGGTDSVQNVFNQSFLDSLTNINNRINNLLGSADTAVQDIGPVDDTSMRVYKKNGYYDVHFRGNPGTVTSVTATSGVGIIAQVTNPTSTPNITMRVDTAIISTRNYVNLIRDSLKTLIRSGGDTTINNGGNDTTIVDSSTVTISDTISWYIVNPSTIRNALTLKLAANPKQGQEIKISFGGMITSGVVVRTLSMVPNTGQGLLQSNTPITPEAGETISYKYNKSNSKWYRL